MHSKLTVEYYAAMINHYTEIHYKLSLCENHANRVYK